MGILKTLFRPRSVFRPDIEAMLDSEMRRHKQAIQKLTEYALEQQKAKAETPGERASGGTDEPGADTAVDG